MTHLDIAADVTADQLETGFQFRHNLDELELFAPEGIGTIARNLPPASAEGGLDGLVADGGLDYQAEPMMEAADAVATLTDQDKSVYLYHLESYERTREVLDAVAGDAVHRFGVKPDRILGVEGYLFLSPGPSVTSAHVDHEWNFLCVLRGTKQVFVADVPSPEAEAALERLHSGGYGACGAVPEKGTMYTVSGGEGVFIPPRAAHYVVNGEEPCAALSVVLVNRDVVRQTGQYWLNAKLRRIGLNPAAPGESPTADRVNSAVGRAAVRTLKRLR